MCYQCVKNGDPETTWLHWCPGCLAARPWTHKHDARWRINLRKLSRFFTGRFSIRIDWDA